MQRIFFRGGPTQADADSFVSLGGPYGRDRHQAFFRDSPVVGSHAESFEFLASTADDRMGWYAAYARDRHRVYYRDTVIEGADPASFTVLSANLGLGRDAHHLFHQGAKVPVQPVNVAGLRMLEGAYATDGTLVYWAGAPTGALQVVSTSVDAFHQLDHQYARAGDEALFEGAVVAKANAEALRVVAPGLASDGLRVYRHGVVLEPDVEVDASMVRLLTPRASVHDEHSPYFFGDGRRVFCFNGQGDSPVKTPHPERFVALDGVYGHDSVTVFAFGHSVEADPRSLRSLGHGFAASATEVLHDGSVLEGVADPATLRHLAHVGGVNYLVDSRHAYFEEHQFSDHADWSDFRVMEGADPASFEVISALFSRDARTVFAHGRPMPDVDAARVRSPSPDTVTDGHRVWHCGVELHGLLAASVCECGGGYLKATARAQGRLRTLGDGYAANDTYVFYRGDVVTQGDAASFESLGGGFARDAHHAFHYALGTESTKMPDYQPWGGVLGGVDPGSARRLGTFHFADDQGVFWLSSRLEDADPETFRALGDQWGVDADRVYYRALPVEQADAATFEALGDDRVERREQLLAAPKGCYGKDGARLFCGREPVEGIDPVNFRALDRFFGTDGRAVLCFLDAQRVDHADPATFRVLGHGYARDQTRVYYASRPIALADAPTFVVLADGYAKDRGQGYSNGEVMTTLGDVAAFRSLGHDFATDGHQVFRWGRPLSAEAATFRVLPEHGFAQDGSTLWSLGGECGDLALGEGGWVEFLRGGYLLVNGTLHWGDTALRARRDSFEVLDEGYARDAADTFYRGRVIATDEIT